MSMDYKRCSVCKKADWIPTARGRCSRCYPSRPFLEEWQARDARYEVMRTKIVVQSEMIQELQRRVKELEEILAGVDW